MSSMRPGSLRWNSGLTAKLATMAWLSPLAALLAFAAASPHARAQQFPSNSGWRDVNLAEYRQHLAALDSVVADCQALLKLKKPAPASNNACDPDRVGPNDRVQVPGMQAREVRYDWLRTALTHAGDKGSTGQPVVVGAPPRAKSQPMSASDLLNQASRRLEMDERQAGSSLAANSTSTNPAYTAERKSLDTILAQREYQGMTKVSLRDRALEWLGNLFDRILTSLAGMGSRAPWAARLLEGLLLGGIWHRADLVLHPHRAQRAGAPHSRRRARTRIAFGARMAVVDKGRADRSRKRFVARCHSFCLLGIDCAVGIAAACGPPIARAHRGNISAC